MSFAKNYYTLLHNCEGSSSTEKWYTFSNKIARCERSNTWAFEFVVQCSSKYIHIRKYAHTTLGTSKVNT